MEWLNFIVDLPGWENFKWMVLYLSIALIVIGCLGWNAIYLLEPLKALVQFLFSSPGAALLFFQGLGVFCLYKVPGVGIFFWFSFFWCLVLPTSVFFYLHHRHEKYLQKKGHSRRSYFLPTQFSQKSVLKLTQLYSLVLWCACAVALQSALLAFMGVGAGFAFCGFVFFHLPGMVLLGFEEEWWVPTSALQGFLVNLFLVGLLISQRSLGHFSVALQFWGPLVHSLAMLIWSSRRYDSRRPFRVLATINLLTLFSFLFLLFFAVAWFPEQLPTMRSVIVCFFVVFLLEKWASMPMWSSNTFLMVLLTGIFLLTSVLSIEFVKPSLQDPMLFSFLDRVFPRVQKS